MLASLLLPVLALSAVLATPITGPICYFVPAPSPDPFTATPNTTAVANLLLSNTNGYGTLSKESFSTSWSYGDKDTAISAFVSGPPGCGSFIYLNVDAGSPGSSYRSLSWSTTATSSWDAAVGTDLVSTDYGSSTFVACKTVTAGTADPIWVLLLVVNAFGTDPIPATTSAGTISRSSCVKTKIHVNRIYVLEDA